MNEVDKLLKECSRHGVRLYLDLNGKALTVAYDPNSLPPNIDNLLERLRTHKDAIIHRLKTAYLRYIASFRAPYRVLVNGRAVAEATTPEEAAKAFDEAKRSVTGPMEREVEIELRDAKQKCVRKLIVYPWRRWPNGEEKAQPRESVVSGKLANLAGGKRISDTAEVMA